MKQKFQAKIAYQILFIDFTLVKRFSSTQFLHKRKMIWVNDLIADEICQKNANAAKCEKIYNAAILVVMRAVTLK